MQGEGGTCKERVGKGEGDEKNDKGALHRAREGDGLNWGRRTEKGYVAGRAQVTSSRPEERCGSSEVGMIVHGPQ